MICCRWCVYFVIVGWWIIVLWLFLNVCVSCLFILKFDFIMFVFCFIFFFSYYLFNNICTETISRHTRNDTKLTKCLTKNDTTLKCVLTTRKTKHYCKIMLQHDKNKNKFCILHITQYAVVKRSIPVRGQTPHHKITLHNTNFCHIAILILDIIQIF